MKLQEKRFSIVVPSYNSEKFIEQTLLSIIAQRESGIEVELIVIDGNSTDSSVTILNQYKDEIDILLVESDTGPANAINKGLALAKGDILAWLNADDVYTPGALKRVAESFDTDGKESFCFGRCQIIDEQGGEIRTGITRFKELFFPINCRFTYQCINYISQPATFFSRSAFTHVGPLREDMVAAWDYEFFLRLWAVGKGLLIEGTVLSSFRWHESSISGQNFAVQFEEELEAAAADAGKYAPQTLLHHCVRWGIVGIYHFMAKLRKLDQLRVKV